ncbi:mannosyltransferase [Rhodococcus triatomae]|uniref:Alpha-1,2-mannosyltransferase n=1 Tax=Rhodococcus triatomae TaxID=300028 RepID=A0A1G7ZG70_9NOCA|nr:mannosyltransferase [Rhodococcus triatomae]QNG22284.1 mannosyltransferase [Rhodococcus triatomae]SDH07742.1 alpha-1,2-mannosyltransferase [Rhodococcus triatomae]
MPDRNTVAPRRADAARVTRAFGSLLRWALRRAPILLAVSVVLRLAWTLLSPNGMNFVDLHVYVDGSASLLDSDLYSYTYAEVTPDFPLPFTYPPFAALVFLPLHFLPFAVVAVAWQLATIAALYAVVRMTFTLLTGSAVLTPRRHGFVLLWTTVGVWSEPVRTTLDYGQVNVFLVALVMAAVSSPRWWVAGGLVGLAAGVKLTPAVTGLYFLARRQWKAAAFSALTFAGTVAVSFLLIGSEARQYFTTLFGDADRIGPVGSVWNQSLRGTISRILGYDVETGPIWIASVLVAAALAFAAWRAIGRDDALGTLVIVQLFGLLVSPISWSHHWVWLVPMAIWLLHGPYGRMLGTRVVAGFWLVSMLVGVPWVLSAFQESIWVIPRPAILAWLGAVDVIGVVAVLLWVIYAARVTRGSASRSPRPDPGPVR